MGRQPGSTSVLIARIWPSATPDRSHFHNDVVYVETTHPSGAAPAVAWTLDGAAVANPANSRNLRLSNLAIAPGSHTLVATTGDDTGTWTIDASPPSTTYTASTPRATVSRPGAEVPEYIIFEARSA